MAGRIFVGDYGVIIRVSTGIDLTNATAQKYKIYKPNGIKTNWSANIVVPAIDGILTYTTVANDFDIKGEYKLQAEVTFAAGNFLGEVAVFKVFDPWEMV